jgi:hypothetical protein
MAKNDSGVVVTEKMLIEAARAGGLERLTIWTTQGVRVTTGMPLLHAVGRGHLEVVRFLVRKMGANVSQASSGVKPLIVGVQKNNPAMLQCLVVELGADVNQAMLNDGCTPLIAACRYYLDVVRCLVELGADAGAVDIYGNTALLISALSGRYATMKYLLEEAGANMDDVTNAGVTVWDMMVEFLKEANETLDLEAELLALTGLLRVLVLHGAPPSALVALLSPEPARVVHEGAQLRARLPAYLVRRRALLDAHCPVLLPTLRAVVHGYVELTTTEELWVTGLGTAP